MFCKNCGKQLDDNAKFCPSCGTKIDSEKSNAQTISTITPTPTKKKKGCGCVWLASLIFILFVLFCALLVGSQGDKAGSAQNTSSGLTSEQWLEFDTKTWDDFVSLYNSHNNFMSTITAFSNGQLNSVTFYTACTDAKNVFAQKSLAFNYGETQEQKEYLSVFQSVALSDQLAAESLMKYLDTHKTSDLSNAQSHIQSAKQAISIIASNRGILLATKTDLTQEEIEQRISDSMMDIETQTN